MLFASASRAAAWRPFDPLCGFLEDTSGRETAFEIQARWVAQAGPFHESGTLRLRQLDEKRVSMALDLPDSPFLPRRQYLLREGDAMLLWELPGGSRPLLEEGSVFREALSSMPPAAWTALITGRDVERFFERVEVLRTGGRRRVTGDFANGQGVLAGTEVRPRTLHWRGPAGEYRFRWRSRTPHGRSELVVQLPGDAIIRIISRMRPIDHMSEEAWLFLEESASFLEPARFSLVEAEAIPHELEP